ncbi:MAG TPA: hypothetical protein VHT53_09135 [Candidatus Elarobacter sp.]|nr:hypothetical protein [Candidatus Elarobacter sp.]
MTTEIEARFQAFVDEPDAPAVPSGLVREALRANARPAVSRRVPAFIAASAMLVPALALAAPAVRDPVLAALSAGLARGGARVTHAVWGDRGTPIAADALTAAGLPRELPGGFTLERASRIPDEPGGVFARYRGTSGVVRVVSRLAHTPSRTVVALDDDGGPFIGAHMRTVTTGTHYLVLIATNGVTKARFNAIVRAFAASTRH